MTRLRWGSALLLVTLGVLSAPAAAAAHPLGNFTTNQYAGLRVAADGVDIDYVLDLAELPAYQAQHDIDTDRDGTPGQAERDRYAAATCTAAGVATTVTVDGSSRAVTASPVAFDVSGRCGWAQHAPAAMPAACRCPTGRRLARRRTGELSARADRLARGDRGR